ncbi:unnamed protein product [Rhodiola kirilowii]
MDYGGFREMQQLKLGSRVNVAELKGLIVKMFGMGRTKRYFYYLDRFLNQKLSKSEFDKLCQQVLGRGNISLHNQLITCILKNVCTAQSPSVSIEDPAKPASEPCQGQARLQFGVPCTSAVTWANVLASPREVRLDNHDWKFRNHHSLTENEKDMSVPQPLRRQCLSKTDDVLFSSYRKEKGAEQSGHLNYSSSPLLAPLGIPFCSASIGGSRKALPVTSTDTHLSCCFSGELSETETLRTRMEKIAVEQNLGRVSMESANLLNKMLDVYLKRLIRSCIDLVTARSGDATKSYSVLQKEFIHGKYMNGLTPNNQQQHIETSGGVETMHEERPRPALSLLDFKVAMELNPHQLGEDWPSIFEKICMYSFED